MPSEFNLLRELAQIVKRYSPARSQTVDLRQKDLYSRIYEALLDQSIRGENELVGQVIADPDKRGSFHVVRSQLKERLFNMLFMLDLPDDNPANYRRAVFGNARTVFISETLTIFGLYHLAARQARSGLKEAKTFELTLNSIHFLRQLLDRAAQSGQKDLYLKLAEEKNAQLDLYASELRARELWNRLAVDLSITGSPTPELTREAIAASEELEKIYKTHKTFNIGLEYYRVTALSLELQENYESTVLLCGEARRFIEGYPQFSSPVRLGEFSLRRLESALHLGNYDVAIDASKECQALYPQDNTNWFFYMEYEFQLRMHLSEFEEALRVYREVTENPRFHSLQETRQQRWALFEFYLEYALGKFSDQAFAKRRLAALERFKLSSTPYTKDKDGFNLAIMILEFMILLDSRQFEAIAEKIDALRVYRQRYLKHAEASGAFLQFLIMIARNVDRPEAIKKWAAKEGPSIEAGMKKPTANLEGIQVLRYTWLYARIRKAFEGS